MTANIGMHADLQRYWSLDQHRDAAGLAHHATLCGAHPGRDIDPTSPNVDPARPIVHAQDLSGCIQYMRDAEVTLDKKVREGQGLPDPIRPEEDPRAARLPRDTLCRDACAAQGFAFIRTKRALTLVDVEILSVELKVRWSTPRPASGTKLP